MSIVWLQGRRQVRLELTALLKSAPLLVLLLIVVMLVVAVALQIGENRGTPVYPVTGLMLRAIGLSLATVLPIVLVFYSGELVWRERALRVDGVLDALPVPNRVLLAGKLVALAGVIFLFLAAGVVSTVAVQLGRGYFHLEPVLYAKGLAALGLSFLWLAVVALFVQVLTNHKFLGFLLMILVIGSRTVLPMVGLEHNLLRFGAHPGMPHSDMNGFGHHAVPFAWFNLYWALVCVVLLIVSELFWVRGKDSSMRVRLALARARARPGIRAGLAAGLLAAVATGAYVVYNTNVLNEYRSREVRRSRRVAYEKNYAKYREAALPRVTSVTADVDIYPRERRVDLRGRYRLLNAGSEPIRVLPITLSPRLDHGYLPLDGGVTLEELRLPAHRILVADPQLGFYAYELEDALEPGETLDLGFDVSVVHRGFVNNRSDHLVVQNGTLFANKSFFPLLGYARSNQLLAPSRRGRYGLPPAERMAKLDDVAARSRNYLQADWIEFETTVSTSLDQTAIAPGRLAAEWTEGGRRFFRYETQAPIINFFCYISGAYEVRRDRWGDVAIEVYYHPGHAYNIDRMIHITKKSLDYFTANFGPYPHGELRIVEVPNYIGLTAFSLAGTIPVSEAWAFIRKIDAHDIDVVSFVLAHEIAHLWWNHQVIGADVQGATLISETLSEYSALMVLEQEQGEEMVRRFLRYDLDQYLKHRGDERIEELPLLLVENQEYIHYFKGSLAMYALRDHVGQAAINRALRHFVEAQAFEGPPYTTSRELLAHLGAAIPPDRQYLVDDLFRTITFFDNRASAATYHRRDDGRYVVRLETVSTKLRADGRGEETEVPIGDWIDIGVFGEKENPLLLEKRQITSPTTTFELVVDARPARAGIDPYHRLIDRQPDDNLRRVVEVER